MQTGSERQHACTKPPVLVRAYTELNNPPFSYESQGRVTARFGTAESCRESIWKMNRIQIPQRSARAPCYLTRYLDSTRKQLARHVFGPERGRMPGERPRNQSSYYWSFRTWCTKGSLGKHPHSIHSSGEREVALGRSKVGVLIGV